MPVFETKKFQVLGSTSFFPSSETARILDIPDAGFHPFSKNCFPDKPVNPKCLHGYTEVTELRTGLFVAEPN